MKGVSHNGYEDDSGKRHEIFSPPELEVLAKAIRVVDLLPETTPDGGLVRCHEVARIVGCLLKLPVQDGKYGLVEHSWLWTRKLVPRYPRVMDRPKILDPYCVGNLPVVRLLDSAPSVPHLGWAYQPGKERTDILKDFVRSEVARIRRLL